MRIFAVIIPHWQVIPNIILQLDVRRLSVGISSSTGSTPSQERSEHIDILANYGIIATLQ